GHRRVAVGSGTRQSSAQGDCNGTLASSATQRSCYTNSKPLRDGPMPEPAERPPIATQPISLVLVAHNAAADIEGVVKSWTTQLDALARPYEILIVDDGS